MKKKSKNNGKYVSPDAGIELKHSFEYEVFSFASRSIFRDLVILHDNYSIIDEILGNLNGEEKSGIDSF